MVPQLAGSSKDVFGQSAMAQMFLSPEAGKDRDKEREISAQQWSDIQRVCYLNMLRRQLFYFGPGRFFYFGTIDVSKV